MRILVVAYEFPYPPTTGGRSDIWRRLKALRSLGHEVMLITWAYQKSGFRPSEDQVAIVSGMVTKLTVMDISASTLRRGISLMLHPYLPWPALCRLVPNTTAKGIERDARAFGPAVLLVDGLYGLDLAKRLSASLDIPLAYRSHNIEYEYVSALWRAATGLKEKLRLSLYHLGLRRFEKSAFSHASVVYDISADGATHWRSHGYSHVEVLPPFLDDADSKSDQCQADQLGEVRFLCGYLGNLYSPANVYGIKWFCEQVLHLLPSTAKVLIAGSRPTADVVAFLGRYPQVTLWPDPPMVSDVYNAVQVLINPIFHGSGVSIKTVDMMGSGKPVISTSVAKRGLSAEACEGFFFGDDPGEFAAAIQQCAVHAISPANLEHRRLIVEEQFGRNAIRRFDDSLQRIIQ